jgi:hypothetical protein
MIENMLNIAAPAEKVFDFVVDVRNEPQWNPQMVHAEMLSPEPVGVGTTFRVRFGRGVGDGLINRQRPSRSGNCRDRRAARQPGAVGCGFGSAGRSQSRQAVCHQRPGSTVGALLCWCAAA